LTCTPHAQERAHRQRRLVCSRVTLAAGKIHIRRASKSLPCALFQAHDKGLVYLLCVFYKAHDKSLVCRALEKHTIKVLFVVRFICARQSIPPFHTLNKPNIIFFKKYFAVRIQESARPTLCVVRFLLCARQIIFHFSLSPKSN
jgi:hypothetical protein